MKRSSDFGTNKDCEEKQIKKEIRIIDGHDSSSYFWIMPIKVLNYSDTNDWENTASMISLEISIEEDGTVFISSPNALAVETAKSMVEGLTAEVEVGKEYKGKVTRIMNFGAFVEILPGKEGLVHISKLSKKHVKKVEDVVSIGEEIVVKVEEIDKQGRINLIKTM